MGKICCEETENGGPDFSKLLIAIIIALLLMMNIPEEFRQKREVETSFPWFGFRCFIRWNFRRKFVAGISGESGEESAEIIGGNFSEATELTEALEVTEVSARAK
ncbi:hypothetical protein KFK09_027029 [Dendrobium nobile]|uniref:Uncharacterized protein n=1 Tax=Dendrobium nobile TaxID=94219 RepID=A0A8T3A9J0_DENNO|nr:hypothetical protein KFK09_027029 [Dendrobium nobile]